MQAFRMASSRTRTDLGEHRTARWAGGLALVFSLTLLWQSPLAAARRRPAAPQGPAPAASAWIVMNAATGEVLSSQEPDRVGAPASMTKMMIALLVMEAVKDGQLKLTDPVKTSAWASHIGGSRVYLKEGEVFPVEDLMAAVLIGSANDAAVALAEHLAGDTRGAVARMNDQAAALHLTHTHFGSVHGLPPDVGQEGDVTTPADMARLCQELLKYPDILRWTSTVEAPFRQGAFILRNSNHLIGRFSGADGMKTGYFHAAGYNVTATAKRGNLRLIAVVMGAHTNADRFTEAARLLSDGFARYVDVTVAKAGTPLGTDIRLPRAKAAFRAVATADLRVMVKREERDAIQTSLELQPGLRAPLAKGQPIGALIARVGGREVGRAPLVAPANIGRAFFWWLTPWR